MYIDSIQDGASGCMQCDTTDNTNECPYIPVKGTDDKIFTTSFQQSSVNTKKQSVCCNTITRTAGGVLLIIISIIGLIFPPLDFMLWEKLNMRPGLPPFEWWSDPPDEVKMRIYVFNVTNHQRFMLGLDPKINVQEIGPIVYLEKLTHTNIHFNDNNTMTYTAKRHLIYLPEDNTIDMNATIIVPNMAVLGVLSYLHNVNYFVRTAVKYLISSQNSQLFVKKTIHDFMWDFKDPVVELSAKFVPNLLPVSNVGLLNVIYFDLVDEVTVKIGPQWGHKDFFRIQTVRGVPQMAQYDPDVCPDRLTGSTEGLMYPQYLTKQDVLLYMRKSVCKIMPLYFDTEAVLDGVPVYRYNLTENVHDRITNGTDCYATEPALPNGISDASKCFYNYPVVASYPHFYTESPPNDEYVTGLTPDKSKHSSYIYVEPKTGVPFISIARMQCNLRVHDLSSFNSPDMNKFSNLIIPLGWIEYNQEDLPKLMKYTIYFMVVILNPLSNIMFSILLVVTSLILGKKIFLSKLTLLRISSMYKRRKHEDLKRNKICVYEKKSFIENTKT